MESRLEASGSGRDTQKGKAKQTTLTHFRVPVLKRTSCSFLTKDLQISKTEVSHDLNWPSKSSSTCKGRMSDLLFFCCCCSKDKKKTEELKKAQQELLHHSSMWVQIKSRHYFNFSCIPSNASYNSLSPHSSHLYIKI